MNKRNLYDPYNGFIRGNMFEDLFDQYGKVYNIKPLNEQAQLLTYLDMLEFACVDIILYLDIHSDDMEMIQKYNKIKEEKNNILKEYESKYGPIELNSENLNNIPWIWNEEPWPWEV